MSGSLNELNEKIQEEKRIPEEIGDTYKSSRTMSIKDIEVASYKNTSLRVIQKKREYHMFCGETRIFIIKLKNIQDLKFWTFKSCLSYVPSFKSQYLAKGVKSAEYQLSKFLERFIETTKRRNQCLDR